MSKSEHLDNEEQGLPGTKGSGPSRRRFIRNIAIGTAGAAVAVSNLDRLHGASRLLERLTNAHVDGFLDQIKDVTASPQAKQEFERILSLIYETVGNDLKSRDTYNAVKHYLKYPAVPVPEGVQISDVDMLLGAGYMRAMAGLQKTTKHVTANDVRNRLQNPKAILHLFEAGFFNQLYAKTKAERASNPNFAKKLDAATRDARWAATHIANEAVTAKLIPASFFQGCDCDVSLGNQSGCVSWEWCVAIVGFMVLILIVAK